MKSKSYTNIRKSVIVHTTSEVMYNNRFPNVSVGF